MDEGVNSRKGNPKIVLAIALAVVVIVAVGFFVINNKTETELEIRANVTILSPTTVGIDRDTCDASGFSVDLLSGGRNLARVRLNEGVASHGDDGDACMYEFTANVSKAGSYTLVAPGSGLPPMTLNEVSKRIFTDDGEYIRWHVLWEP